MFAIHDQMGLLGIDDGIGIDPRCQLGTIPRPAGPLGVLHRAGPGGTYAGYGNGGWYGGPGYYGNGYGNGYYGNGYGNGYYGGYRPGIGVGISNGYPNNGYYSPNANNNYYQNNSGMAYGAPTTNGVPNPPYAGGGEVLIVNPAENSSAVSYSLNGLSYNIKPGETQRIANDRPWVIQFDRGDNQNAARYTLSQGHFKFKSTDQGVELVRAADQSGRRIRPKTAKPPLPNDPTPADPPAPKPSRSNDDSEELPPEPK